jgi:hypothetical protein
MKRFFPILSLLSLAACVGDDPSTASTPSNVRPDAAPSPAPSSTEKIDAGPPGCNGPCEPKTIVKDLNATLSFEVGSDALLVLQADGMYRCAKDGCAAPTRVGDANTPMGPSFSVAGTPAQAQFLIKGSGLPALMRVQPDLMSYYLAGTVKLSAFSTDAWVSDAREFVEVYGYGITRCILNSSSANRCGLEAQRIVGDEGPRAAAISEQYYVMGIDYAGNRKDRVFRCDRPAPGATAYASADCVNRTSIADADGAKSSSITPGKMKIVGNRVFWVERAADKDTLRSCAISTGCSAGATILARDVTIDAFAVDGNGAYWTERAAGKVRACRNLSTGCSSEAIENIAVGQTEPTWVGIDPQHAYWLNQGAAPAKPEIKRVPR